MFWQQGELLLGLASTVIPNKYILLSCDFVIYAKCHHRLPVYALIFYVPTLSSWQSSSS
jgi:hypothetical protein